MHVEGKIAKDKRCHDGDDGGKAGGEKDHAENGSSSRLYSYYWQTNDDKPHHFAQIQKIYKKTVIKKYFR